MAASNREMLEPRFDFEPHEASIGNLPHKLFRETSGKGDIQPDGTQTRAVQSWLHACNL